MDINEQLLSEAGQIVTKQPGEVIFRSGEPGVDMYVVLNGEVDVFLEQDGRTIPVAKLGKGDFFGEMSLLEEMPRSGTVVASRACTLVLLQQDSFRKLMQEDSMLAWRVMKGLSTRIRGLNRELAQRIGHDLQEVSKLLHENAQGLSASITHIAASAQEIDTNEKHLAGQIQEVQTISKNISEMLQFIRNVASQTHILGLNAAIEAARSGEHGRGFGIIAEEIRKLSAVSKQNAEKIAELTELISIKMDAVTAASQDSASKSNEQADATQKMVASVGKVTGLAERLTGIANSLA
ncbi:methyl-accepting chemotaxis protein [Paenibacillus radicis (ex Xue et al. 2023)]|uniref:Methyl-accepting chemotaxis protein n=1 Tax=Paenibacillus radicis (ex Xue et al. 2023) TaxID=2972489 RepID=A0ABT1YET4_9BACL|nr:methyl-accepting chemotaxis protein [Paenibacillus radicis (ex Xue et al. 2023)]MCR8631713.1 methyl-accepting chemotaxis protein [Paenibacillus radicis (ex Xue et al. 2023)]